MSESEDLGLSFVMNYSKLLTGVWTSEEEAARLAADPAAYAREKGLPVEAGAEVRVDSTPHEGLFHKDEVVAAWTATPGVHTLLVPATPLIDLNELDEADLELVSAGDNNNIIFILL
jgi:hypothetical protein